jgi:hypothetical protein
MSGIPAVSLRRLGLWAPDGLECPEGGQHQCLEPQVIIAAASEDGGVAICRKCGQGVRLEPLQRRA